MYEHEHGTTNVVIILDSDYRSYKLQFKYSLFNIALKVNHPILSHTFFGNDFISHTNVQRLLYSSPKRIIPKVMSSNREFILQTVQIYPNSFEFASFEMQQDKEIILKAIETEWKEDRSCKKIESTEFGISRLSESFLSLRMVRNLLQNDKEFGLKANKYCSHVLAVFEEINRELVLEYVKTNGKSLTSAAYFDKSYLNDRKIVMAALKENIDALENILLSEQVDSTTFIESLKEIYSQRGLENRNNMLNAVRENGFFLILASEEFKKDREIVLSAVKQNGWSLKFSDEIYKKDKEIIKIALDNDWKSRVLYTDHRVFMFADSSLKNDKEFIIEILSDHSVLKYINQELLLDREFSLKAVQTNTLSFRFIPQHFKNDKEIFIAALNHTPLKNVYYNNFMNSHRGDSLVSNVILGMVNEEFRSDKELVLMAVKLSGYNLTHAHQSLREDREIIFTAASHSPLSIMQTIYTGDSLGENKDLILEIIEKFAIVLPRSYNLEISFAIQAVSLNGLALKYFKAWKANKNVVIKAVQQNYKAIEYADPMLWEDPDVIREALKHFNL